MKTELEDSLDTTAAVQDLRTKREEEVREMKKSIEASQRTHEAQVAELKSKYNKQEDQMNEELENVKKVGHILFMILCQTVYVAWVIIHNITAGKFMICSLLC